MAKNKFKNTIARIFLAIILICAIGLIVSLVVGPSTVIDTISPIYLTIGSDKIEDSASDYLVDSKSTLNVAVGYSLDISTSRTYTVKVVPNKIEGKDFDVVADGIPFSYQAIKDLTPGFDITQSDKEFSIKAKGGIRTILSYVYPNNDIEDCTNKAYQNMFTLLVTSGDKTISVDFTVIEHDQAISFNKNQVIF